MIIGIGIDLVSFKRFESICLNRKERLINKILTKKEIQQAHKDIDYRFLAKRYSVKEAFSKCLGLGIGKIIGFKDIEVINNNLNQPKIYLSESLKEFIIMKYSIKKYSVHVTVSDELDTAVANVVIEGD